MISTITPISAVTTAPPPFVLHGVSLGPAGGVMVAARHADDRRPHVVDVRQFPAALTGIGDAIEEALADDPDCRVVIDAGLHGLDLWNHLGGRRRMRLRLFETPRPELRRHEIGGKLRSLYEMRGFTVQRSVEGVLRKALADATREDAAERPEIVALSLAVVDRRRLPRIG